MKRVLILLSIVLIWTCSSSSSKPTEPTVPTQPPTVNNLTLTTNEDTPTTFTMTGTDPGNFALTFSIATQPQHGTLTTSGSSGTYTPKANYNGEDTFGFIATNGTLTSTAGVATITIAPVDDNPNTMNVSAVTDEDNAVEITLEAEEYDGDTISFNIKDNPANGAVTLSGDKATYTPNENYFGADSFTFEAVDTTAKTILNTATASITINPINDAPAVEDMQEVEGVEDTELTITLTGTDIDGDNLSFEVDAVPTQGTITENGTTFTYTPNQDFYGADSLTYKAYDGTEYSEAKKIPLFIDRGPRDWPFIVDMWSIDSTFHQQIVDWEGKQFNYDQDADPDMIGYLISGVFQIASKGNYNIYNQWDYEIRFTYNLSDYFTTDEVDFFELDKGVIQSDGDLNNDGIADLFINPQKDNPNTDGSTAPGPVIVGLSSGYDYNFSIIDETEQFFWQNGYIQFFDFNRDGYIDIVGQNSEYNQTLDNLIIYQNNNDGTFTKRILPIDNFSINQFRDVDINSDGYIDMVSYGKGTINPSSLYVAYGTSDYESFNITEVPFDADNYDAQDLTIVDVDNDGFKEILLMVYVPGVYGQENVFKLRYFKNNSGNLELYDNTDLNIEFEGFFGPQNNTQAWDFDNDGDKDIFIWHAMNFRNNSWHNGTCCYCFERDDERIESGEGYTYGYFWKNNDGILEKTYYSTKQDECNFDDF